MDKRLHKQSQKTDAKILHFDNKISKVGKYLKDI